MFSRQLQCAASSTLTVPGRCTSIMSQHVPVTPYSPIPYSPCLRQVSEKLSSLWCGFFSSRSRGGRTGRRAVLVWLRSSSGLAFLLQPDVVVYAFTQEEQFQASLSYIVQGQFGLPKPSLRTQKVTMKILAAAEEEVRAWVVKDQSRARSLCEKDGPGFTPGVLGPEDSVEMPGDVKHISSSSHAPSFVLPLQIVEL